MPKTAAIFKKARGTNLRNVSAVPKHVSPTDDFASRPTMLSIFTDHIRPARKKLCCFSLFRKKPVLIDVNTR